MAYTTPSVADFKAWFANDFNYGTTNPSTPQVKLVSDADVQQSLDYAGRWLPTSLLPSQGQYSDAYLYLAAHALASRMQETAGGPYSQYNGLQQSKSVGDVSEAFAIPTFIQRNPLLSAFCTTRYGARYVMLIAPYMVGNVGLVEGMTTA